MNKSIVLAIIVMLCAPTCSFAWGNDVKVNGYTRRDGTYVQPHYRTRPDNNPNNNYSSPGNTNPYTGERAGSNFNSWGQPNTNNSNVGGMNSFGINNGNGPRW